MNLIDTFDHITLKKNIMFKKFKLSEIVILICSVILIFVSEYYYTVLKDHDRAIFIGLWPPTMLIMLNYFNNKTQK